jgi:hypothetical protein
MILLHLADWFFRTRRANLVTLLLTGLSWTLLGIWYGFGYCPLTDWHWKVLDKLGVTGLPNSYMKYLIDRLTGLDMDPTVVDYITGTTFIAALVVSVILNVRDYRGKRKVVEV